MKGEIIRHCLEVGLIYIYPLARILLLGDLLFAALTYIDNEQRDYSRIFMKKYSNAEIGRYSYGFNRWTFWGSVKIGQFCSIAPNVTIGATKHPIDTVTSHPFLFDPKYSVNPLKKEDRTLGNFGNVTIGNDVYIGINALIMPGINIGDGAVIGAETVVTKDIPPYAIVVGVPGRIKNYRFAKATICKLLEIKWWDWTDERIKENFESFKNPEIFIKFP
jgi:virginiamycin A acetyltransferase